LTGATGPMRTAADEEWPSRTISSRALALAAIASVAAVCRRSCKRRPSTPTARVAGCAGHRLLRIAGPSVVGVTVTAMRLEMMTAEDVELRLRAETDPVMMAELGGPRPPEDVKRAHAKALVLPEFQGRGIASQAVRTVLDQARAERKFGRIHAFPAVTNGPSNKVCEKNGFANLGECEVGFAGRTLRCCHWRIDLF
jgi:hypothetical protein